MYTIGSILQAFPTRKTSLYNSGAEITRLAYDSRRLGQAETSLFFALKGARDGHLFLLDAYKQGVRNFVVSNSTLSLTDFPDCNFIWVDDTLEALQRLAAFHRDRFGVKVIGITGSNGKTIVKEWLHQMLSIDYNCYQSPKSYNSQLGVALSLWEIQDEHQIALIEAGISQVGEMPRLEEMIQPEIGVLTSLGPAHAEGFSSKEQKFAEKWKLFKHARKVVAPSGAVAAEYRTEQSMFWGTQPDDTLRITHTSRDGYRTDIAFDFEGLSYQLNIPFVDHASVENVMTCVAVMLVLGYQMEVIQSRVLTLQTLEMRLKLKRGKNNCSIVDDSYSNDLASLRIALDFLKQQNQHAKKSLILTDFVDAGWNDRIKAKLIKLLHETDFHQFVLVGVAVVEIADELRGKVHVFTDTSGLIASLPELQFRGETILIKGARKFTLEKVVNLLVQKTHGTSLEINLKAIEHNLAQYRSRLQPNVKLMVMVKAFSYGSGSFEIANMLQFNKVDYLTVAFVDEGVELRQGGVTLPIMVLSPEEDAFEDLLRYDLEPEIFSFRILGQFIDFLERRGVRQYPIHLKLDTGMHRLGFVSDEQIPLLDVLERTDRVRVVSVFSHFVAAGNPEFEAFSNEQVRLFRNATEQIERRLGYVPIRHMCNSSAIVQRPQDHMEMVRLGIGLYGIQTISSALPLQHVGVLKTTITQIKSLRRGDTVGYDRKGVLHKDGRIATVKIGYADGYDRRFGNGVGHMLLKGRLVPTIGNVCMDMCMLDISDVDGHEGDEVIVFPDISAAAAAIGTIPYELLAGVSSRVKRVYYYE